MVCSLHLSKDARKVKQVQRKTTKMIKQLPDSGEPRNVGLSVVERKTLSKETFEDYKIMKAIFGDSLKQIKACFCFVLLFTIL